MSRPGFNLPENCPDLRSEIVDNEHYELCVAIIAHGFLDRKAQRKHDLKARPDDLSEMLYDDIVEDLMNIAKELVRLDKLTSDVRGYAAAVGKCVDDGARPANFDTGRGVDAFRRVLTGQHRNTITNTVRAR